MVLRGGTALALVTVLLLGGCATWKKTSRTIFEGGHATAVTASTAGKPLMHQRCLKVAEKCGLAGDATCQELTVCRQEKEKFVHIVVSVHRAAMMGLLSLEIGDQVAVDGWVEKIQALVKQLGELAKQYGLGDLLIK